MRCTQRLQLTFLLALLLALPAASLAQAAAGNMLTNADIVKMVKAGIPESVILREIQMSETNFVTSANALIELKKHNVPDGVLEAIVETGSGARQRQAEPLNTPMVAGQHAVAHLHQLPTFDAAVRLDAKTTAKVSVSNNHIEVKRAGVPLFTLKWKQPHGTTEVVP
jgi:hypothetical protein